MPKKKLFLWIAALLILSGGLYLFCFTGRNMDFVLQRRSLKLCAMLIVSMALGYSSIVFQTISGNRILTPSIMGFDSFYLLIQAVLVYSYGDKTFNILSHTDNFMFSVLLMLGFSLIMYHGIFKRKSRNIHVLLLTGLLFGTLFRSVSSFLSMLLDPNEFMFVQVSMFASFENLQSGLLAVSSLVIVFSLVLGMRYVRQLDVAALGRDTAINLGIDYHLLVRNNLMLISTIVAVSTALVGPVTFLGLIVANLTYQLFKTHRHIYLIPGCCILTAIIVISSQFLVEHLFNMSTTVSVITNLLGGLYFIYILLKSNSQS